MNNDTWRRCGVSFLVGFLSVIVLWAMFGFPEVRIMNPRNGPRGHAESSGPTGRFAEQSYFLGMMRAIECDIPGAVEEFGQALAASPTHENARIALESISTIAEDRHDGFVRLARAANSHEARMHFLTLAQRCSPDLPANQGAFRDARTIIRDLG